MLSCLLEKKVMIAALLKFSLNNLDCQKQVSFCVSGHAYRKWAATVLFKDQFYRWYLCNLGAPAGEHTILSLLHVGHRPFSPLLPQLSHYVSSCDTFISASLPEVTWSPLSKIKFIKTSANVYMEIVWWFLKWIILQWFRICLLIYLVTIEIQHKLKNSFMRHLDY